MTRSGRATISERRAKKGDEGEKTETREGVCEFSRVWTSWACRTTRALYAFSGCILLIFGVVGCIRDEEEKC
jgi:hypothetical protein